MGSGQSVGTGESKEPRKRSLLVTGATGALGPAVIRAFSSDGWHVSTLSRRPPTPGSPAAGVPHFAADLGDEQVLSEAMRDVDVVVHMAALLHVENPGPEMEADYWRVNVEGARNVMRVARAAGVRRVVFISSICVYGERGGRLNEETVPAPDTVYARTKLRAEEAVLEVRQGGTPLGVVLRLGAVYGPTIKGNYARLVGALARRRFVPIGRGLNSRTLVFEEDVARAILLAATHPSAAGRFYNVTDGSYHTVAELMRAICNALGRPVPRYSIPEGPVFAAARLLEALFRAIRKRPPVSRQTLEKFLEDVTVSGEAIMRDLGFAPEWDLDRGWRETVEGMRRLGRI